MPVEITDWDVQFVRTFLSQDDEALKPMLPYMAKRSDPGADEPDGTSLLLRAMFFEACVRRFTGGSRTDVIQFVAHARVRRGRNAPPIDPAVAEKLIIEAVTATPAEGLTEMQRSQHIILLCELIEDENPTWDQLDAYLAGARTCAGAPGKPARDRFREELANQAGDIVGALDESLLSHHSTGNYVQCRPRLPEGHTAYPYAVDLTMPTTAPLASRILADELKSYPAR